jgi:hypothetical protein
MRRGVAGTTEDKAAIYNLRQYHRVPYHRARLSNSSAIMREAADFSQAPLRICSHDIRQQISLKHLYVSALTILGSRFLSNTSTYLLSRYQAADFSQAPLRICSHDIRQQISLTHLYVSTLTILGSRFLSNTSIYPPYEVATL